MSSEIIVVNWLETKNNAEKENFCDFFVVVVRSKVRDAQRTGREPQFIFKMN